MLTENTISLGTQFEYVFTKEDKVLQEFSHKVLNALSMIPNIQYRIQHIAHDFVSLPWKTKGYYKDYSAHIRTTIHSDQIQLQFNTKRIDEIELWWMETKTKGQGMGTVLLNQVLDVADEMGIKITLCPIPQGDMSISTLRNWYSEFEFKGNKFNPYMTYKPQKI